MANPNPLGGMTSEKGKRLRRQRGARAAHAVMLAQGRKLMKEAVEAATAKRRQQRLERALEAQRGPSKGPTTGNLDGI